MAIGEALGGIVGGVLGNNAAKMDRRHAKEQANKALQYFIDLGKAPDTSVPLILRELESAGILTPELEEEIHLQASEFVHLKEDPETRNTQLEALDKFKQQSETGLGGEERAALNQIRQGTQQDVRAKEEQVIADIARSGGTVNPAMRAMLTMQGAQEGANRASTQGDELMAMIAQRVRQGTSDMSGAANQLRQQDYNAASTKATALDERNKYLNQNSVARQSRNVAVNNNAKQSNLTNQQRIQDANTNNYNSELERQQTAKSAAYNQNLARAQGMAGQSMDLSNMYAGIGNAKAKAQVEMGKGVGQIADSGYNTAMGMMGSGGDGKGGGGGGMGSMAGIAAMFSDEKLKTDINNGKDEVQDFLDKLAAVSYNYKDSVKHDPRASESRQLGVMAQDLEKSELGKGAVSESEKGKIVNYEDLQPKMLAALAQLNDRLKKMEGK